MRSTEYTHLWLDPRALSCGRAASLGGKPPLNDVFTPAVLGYVSLALSVAGAAISYDSAQDQARQLELNAEAQNAALKAEQDRQEIEFAENQKRAVVEHLRQRSHQRAAVAHTGLLPGTGTPLVLDETILENQQVQLGDMAHLHALNQRALAYQRAGISAEARSRAASVRSQALGTVLADLASTGYRAYSTFSPQEEPSRLRPRSQPSRAARLDPARAFLPHG